MPFHEILYKDRKACVDLKQVNIHAKGKTKGCEECEKTGDEWGHLRLCLSCGHVGCCDSSKNKNATIHFRGIEHPIIKSFEPDEDWKWCYIDETFLE